MIQCTLAKDATDMNRVTQNSSATQGGVAGTELYLQTDRVMLIVFNKAIPSSNNYNRETRH